LNSAKIKELTGLFIVLEGAFKVHGNGNSSARAKFKVNNNSVKEFDLERQARA